MPGPFDALKTYFASPGDGTDSAPYAPWQKTLQGAVDTGTQGTLGVLGLGDQSSTANRGGALLGAAMPFAGGLKGMVEKGVGGAIEGLRGAAPEEAGAAFHTPSLPPDYTAVGDEGIYNASHALPKTPTDLSWDEYTKLMPRMGGRGKP